MRYCKFVDKSGNITGIGTGSGGEEITEAEYNRLLSEIRSKCDWVDKVYVDPATIDLCPPEWRQEILQRVQERKDAEAAAEEARKNQPPDEAEMEDAYRRGVNRA